MQNRYKYIDEKGEHLHTLDNQPLIGTSSVASVLSKPLAYWASGLAVKEFGCPEPKVITKIKNKKATVEETKAHYDGLAKMRELIASMDIEEYAKLIQKAYSAHASTLKDKAKEGTDLHAELERFVKFCMETDIPTPDTEDAKMFDNKIQPFIAWTFENVSEFLWSEGNCYSEKNWTGGISDVGARLKDGRIAIIDFKSSKEAYLSQFWQCCGYAIQVEENGIFDKDGNQTFKLKEGEKIDLTIVVPFGMDNVYPQLNVDMEGGKEAFLAELLLYKKLPRD